MGVGWSKKTLYLDTLIDISSKKKNIEGSGRNMRQGGERQGGSRSVEAAED